LDVEASAEDIAYVIDQIRERNVRALFIENINNPKLLQMISLESDIVVGGRIYSDALSEIEGPASTYLKMMEHNLMSLIEAFDLKESEV
jgi:zinc/manganese transport system substrate-binding protein